MRNTDWFFDLVVNSIGDVAEELRKYQGSISIPWIIAKDIDRWWIKDFPREDLIRDTALVAIDGGGRFVDLVGGGALYITRAIAVFNSGIKPLRKLIIDIVNHRSKKYMDALRSLTEILVAIDAIEHLPRRSILLIDGSYYVYVLKYFIRATKLLTNIENLRSGEIRLLEKILKLITSLINLVKKAQDKDVTLCYVSKDSNLNLFKELLILKYFKELNPRIYELLIRIDYKQHLNVLTRLKNSLDIEQRKLIDLLLEEDYHDVHLIMSIVDCVGYTRPMKPFLRKTLVNKILDILEKPKIIHKLDEYKGKHDLDSSVIEYIKGEIDYLTTPILSYTKLSVNDNPLMIEIIDSTNIGQSIISYTKPIFTEHTNGFIKALAMIKKGYVNSKYYNIWLVQAHEYSHLTRNMFRYYLNYLDSMLRTRGLRVPLTRRYSLGGIH